MIHIANGTILDIAEEMTTHAHIYNGSEIFFGASTVNIVGYVYFQGMMGLNISANQTIVLVEPAVLTIDSLDTVVVIAYSIEMQANTEFHILNDMLPFHFEIQELIIDGSFTAGELDIINIKKWFVGPTGVVEFNPMRSDLYMGREIDIRGSVSLGKHVSFVQPCDQFMIETGTLTWPATPEIITIECEIVTINGPFTPGTVSFGNGTGDFTVGASGVFTFTADGPFLANTVSIGGKMYVNNLVTMESSRSSDNRIDAFAIHHPSGLLQLNKDSLPVQSNGTADPNVTCSTLKIKSLTVDKTFTADDINTDIGIDSISVGRYGTWTFGPCGTFHMNDFYMNGTVTSKYPLTLEGMGLDKAQQIHIEYGGTLTLDSEAQSTKAWTGTSTVAVHDFQMYGKFYAGLLLNFVAGNEGWDKLDMYVNASFYFEPADIFILDYLYVNGKFESYTKINMTSIDTSLIIHIDTKGSVKFDSLVTSGWTDESYISASQILTESGSYWQSGNTKWVVKEAILGGTLYSYPSSEAEFVYFTVTSTGNVDFSRTTYFRGHGFNINAGGVMDIAYQHTPEDTSRGSEASELLYKTIDINGTLRAGSLHFGHLGNGVQFLENVYISGSIDVSGGGYLYDNGPGAL